MNPWTAELNGILSAYGVRLLRSVCARLCKPRSQWPPAELVDRCLATLANSPVLDRRLRALETPSRLALTLIARSRQPRWRVGSLVEALAALGEADGLAPVVDLLEAGLLYPDLTGRREQGIEDFAAWLARADAYRPPSVLAPLVVLERLRDSGSEASLSEGVRLPSIALSATALEADGLEWPLRLSALWQKASEAPLRRTLQQDFFKRDLDRLRQDPLLSSPSADALIETPDASLLAAALAGAVGLLEDRDADVVAGAFDDAWSEGAAALVAKLWSALPRLAGWHPVEGWDIEAVTHPYSSAYLLALLLLAQAPVGEWTLPADVESWMIEHHPFWLAAPGAAMPAEANRRAARQKRALGLDVFLLGLAFPLRLVQAARDENGQVRVRLAAMGRWVLGLSPAPPQAAAFPQTLLVQPNLEILAYRQGLTPDLIMRLGRIATWRSLGPACTLQLEPGSVYRALEQGETFESIVQLLESRGAKSLPTPVLEALRTWANKRQRITLFPSAALFEFPGPVELNEALGRGLAAVRLTDRLAIVPSEKDIDYRHFRLTGTRDYCLPPDQCVEVQADGVTLSVDLARSDLLLESEVQRFAELLGGPHPPGRRLYRLTAATARAARLGGLSLATLETWFQERAGLALSPAARLLFCAEDLPPIDLRRQLVLHVALPEVADGLEQWPGTRDLIKSRLGPTTLTILEANLDQITRRCQEIGVKLRHGEE